MKLVMPPNCLRGRIACAVVCLSLFVTFQLFASVPKLHNLIHSDSNETTHHCELNLLTQGQVNISTPDGLVTVFIPSVLPVAPLIRTAVASSVHRQLPPGRAPPLA
jgi:hypothetical protein